MSAIPHPRAVELVERAKLRRKVERAVDRLMALLDELDGDPEAEPWLGWPEPIMGWGMHAAPLLCPHGANDDREQDVTDEPHDAEPDEPWLASPERAHDQRRWAAGTLLDLEMGA